MELRKVIGKKIFIGIAGIVLLVVIGVGAYLLLKKPIRNSGENQVSHPLCLSDNEIAAYTIDRGKDESPVDIVIKNKETEKEIYRFVIDSVWPVYYPVQPRKCGIYVIKQFNFDYKKTKPLPGFRVELWRYGYDGEGVPILTFAEEDEKGQAVIYYNAEFLVDFVEFYITLIKGYVGQIDFAAVIKEIKTNKDVFSLMYKRDIIDKYPNLAGDHITFDEWTKDSRYCWGHISEGASVIGFFRIERDTWKVDILPVPEGTTGGTAFNPEYGYITYDTGPGWIGIDVVAEQVYDEWRKEEKTVELHLYDLLNKEDVLLATSTEPSWSGNPQWISDTELQYELPDGIKKTYKIGAE